MESSKLHILVVVNVYTPDLGGGILFADLCEGLVERGYRVTVKCAYSYYPEWEDKSGLNGLKIRSTEENGVHVERYGIYIPRNPNSLFERLMYEASFYLSLRRRTPKKGAYDAVLVFCPLVGAVAYAAAIRRKVHAPLWINVQDLSAQAAIAGGIAGSGLMARTMLRIQNHLFSRADIWSTISRPMVDTLEHTRDYMTRAPVHDVRLVPNWLHRSLADTIRDAGTMPDTIRPSDPVRILYSGNIGTKQDLLRFCRILLDSPVNFSIRIQGCGGRAPELQQWISEVNDPRFKFYPLSDETAFVQELMQSDFYLITEKSEIGNAFVPSKLIPALAAGIPVLAVCDADSPLGEEMEEFVLGPRFDWRNLASDPGVLRAITPDRERYFHWCTNVLHRARFFDREAGLDRCVNLIEDLVASGMSRRWVGKSVEK